MQTHTHVQAAKSRILREIAADLVPTASDASSATAAATTLAEALPTPAAYYRSAAHPPPPRGHHQHSVLDHSDELSLREARRDYEREFAPRRQRRPPSAPPFGGGRPSWPPAAMSRRYSQRQRQRHRRGHHSAKSTGGVSAQFSRWSPWSKCERRTCRQSRERHCYNRAACGTSRHIEERRCPQHSCARQQKYAAPAPSSLHRGKSHRHRYPSSSYEASSINDLDEDDFDEDDESSDTDPESGGGVFYVVRKPHQRPTEHRYTRPNKKKKIVVEVQDYNDDFDARPLASSATRQTLLHHRQRGVGAAVPPLESDDNASGSAEEYESVREQHRYAQRHHNQPTSSRYAPHSSSSSSSRRPTTYYHFPSPSSRRPAAAGGHRHHYNEHRYADEDEDRSSYRSDVRKKYIWDRQTDFGEPSSSFGYNDPVLAASSNEDTSVEPSDGSLDTGDEDDQLDYVSRRRTGGSAGQRSTGYARPTLNQDLNERLDRNYDRIFGADDRAPHYDAQTAATSTTTAATPVINVDDQNADSGDTTADDIEADDLDALADIDPGAAAAAERRQFSSGSAAFHRRWDRSDLEAQWPPGRTDTVGTLNFQAIPQRPSATATTTTTTIRAPASSFQEKAVIELPGIERRPLGPERMYAKWSKWRKCSDKCITTRH